jgi:hypothetical protein
MIDLHSFPQRNEPIVRAIAIPKATSATQEQNLSCRQSGSPNIRPGSRWSLAALLIIGSAGLAQPAAAQTSPPEMEIAHPFLTHEGLPDAVGRVSTRATGLVTQADGSTRGDFGFHFETGLTNNLGIHIRSDEFLKSRRSEAMLQYAIFKSANGESGIAPIVELEFPTRSGGGKARVLVGFTSKLAGKNFAINQVVHYNLSEHAVEASAALVLRATDRIYPVVEVLGEGGRDIPTIVNMLAGVKYRVHGSVLVGLAYKRPISSARDISSQFLLQLEFMVGKRAD